MEQTQVTPPEEMGGPDRADLEEIGNRLHALRYRRKLTLEAVEAATGISAGSQSKWERGIVDPGLMSILKLCWFYEVTPDYVLSDLGSKRVIPNGEPQLLELLEGGGAGQDPVQTSLLIGLAH